MSFEGEFFKADDVSLTPKPLRTPSRRLDRHIDTVKLAAARLRVMAGPPFPLESVRDTLRIYREIAPQGDPKLVLIRFYHLAPTHVQAVDEAIGFLRPFLERMQTGDSCPAAGMDFVGSKLDRMIEETSADRDGGGIRDKVQRLEAELRPRSLILKPINSSFAKQRADLETFGETIKP